MADIIWGSATRVVDGDTFTMDVTHVDDQNEYFYNETETIRVADIDAPELHQPGGRRSRQALQAAVGGRSIRCAVRARDTYHRLVASVRILNGRRS